MPFLDVEVIRNKLMRYINRNIYTKQCWSNNIQYPIAVKFHLIIKKQHIDFMLEEHLDYVRRLYLKERLTKIKAIVTENG